MLRTRGFFYNGNNRKEGDISMKNKGKRKFLSLLLSVFLVSCVSQRKIESSSRNPDDVSSSLHPEVKRSRILYLSDGTRVADRNDVKTRFSSSCGTEEADIDFIFDLNGFPSRIEALDTYDQIVLSDVDVSKVPQKDIFLPALRTFVEEKGKSLFTFGNVLSLESLTPSEEETTPLVTTAFNEMLPLQYDYAASHAICLLIDNSGSMDSDNRMNKAKQGAIACLDYLSDNDYISLVTFSDAAKVFQPLTSAKNKNQVRSSINKIKSEGGTEIIPGLKEADNQLAGANTDYKSLILLSDGDPFETDSQIMKQVRIIASQGITISTINISNYSSSAISLLRRISQEGEGSYTYCGTAVGLVNVMKSIVKENLNFSDGSVVEEDKDGYSVSLSDSRDDSLQGITALPSLYGFDYATKREGAKEVLSTSFSLPKLYAEYYPTEEETTLKTKNSSLFATWKFGNGFVSSFASSFGRKVGDLKEKDEEEDSSASSSEEPATKGKSWSGDFFSSRDGTLFLRQALKANRKQVA